ncbi:GumC family protein [candidate division KSB1 bacterium]
MENRESTILDYVIILLKWKKFIILFTFCVAAITAGITLIAPKWYSSRTTVLVPGEESGLSLSSFVSQIPLGGSFFDFDIESQRFLAILQSRNAQEYVVNSFGLREQYGAENLEEAIRELRSHTDYGITEEGAIYVTVEDKIPAQAADIANTFVRFLDSRNRELKTAQARENREFIEDRYNKVKQALSKAETELKGFQERYHIYALPVQVEAGMEAAAAIHSEKVLLEVELEMRKKDFGTGHPEIQRLQSEIDALNDQLDELEFSAPEIENSMKKSTFLLPFADVPNLGMVFYRLAREISIQSSILTLMVEQLEQAKIQEAQDTPTLQVLDEAVVTERKSRPKRTLIVILAAALAGLFSLCFAFSYEYFRNIGSSSPEEKRKIESIKLLLGNRSRNNE